jgi:hypothetical protein
MTHGYYRQFRISRAMAAHFSKILLRFLPALFHIQTESPFGLQCPRKATNVAIGTPLRLSQQVGTVVLTAGHDILMLWHPHPQT